jgi:1-acyl-sn-glycerol-3-phosphate acyltransferase
LLQLNPLKLPSAIGRPRRLKGLRLLERLLGELTLKLLGWRVEGEIPNLPKLVVAVAPHTSNWDFVIACGVLFSKDIEITFFGKDKLFVPPLSWFLRWLGGIPVNREKAGGRIGYTVETMIERQQIWLGLAPEGTRKQTAQFRTGFLQVAAQAQVPLLLVILDREKKLVKVGSTFTVSKDEDLELARIFCEEYFLPYQVPRYVK